MGADLYAWIEYDAHGDLPFNQSGVDWECLPFKEWMDLSGNKDYPFMAAISGCRNQSSTPPLFEQRGYPPNPGFEVRAGFEAHGPEENTGWLYAFEVWDALRHHGLVVAGLSLEVKVLLSAMRCLEENLGSQRVRLVFAIGSA